MYILTDKQMQNVEAAHVKAGGSYRELMESAGKAVFDGILRHEQNVHGKRCAILCGKGNNGGDGFVLARYMLEAGAEVICVMMGIPKSWHSLRMYSKLLDKGVNFVRLYGAKERVRDILKDSNIIVDAVFGTGFHGEFHSGIRFVADIANKSAGKVYSIDLPSGMETNSGKVCDGCFEADVTFAVATYKLAHFMHYDKDYLGTVEVVDIGIKEASYADVDCDIFSIDRKYVYSKLLPRKKYSNKGDYGKLLCICGSMGMTGAAKLVALSAMKSGAGYVYLACPKGIAEVMSIALTEQIIVPLEQNELGSISSVAVESLAELYESMSACVVGPGMRSNCDTAEIVRELIKNSRCPIIIDADGINAVSSDIDILWTRKSDIVLTPHPGEMARLIGKTTSYVNANRIDVAREFAEKYKVIVVLKGAHTVVASPDGKTFMNTTGNAGLAKAGSGDILTGMIGSLTAQGYDVFTAAVLGVFLHGLAADHTVKRLCSYSMTASDVLDDYHMVFKECDRL